MRIELRRLDAPYHFEAVNEEGAVVHLDAAAAIGGGGKGMRPMQMVLAALGGCSAIDVVMVLAKQREPVVDIRVTIEAEREQGVAPALFRTIQVRFHLYGDLDPAKVRRAVDLSMDKYCSVARLLEPTAAITSSFGILPARDTAQAP